MLWGWAGKPVDEETLKSVAALVDALGGPLGVVLAEHVTADEIVALRQRAGDLLTDPGHAAAGPA